MLSWLTGAMPAFRLLPSAVRIKFDTEGLALTDDSPLTLTGNLLDGTAFTDDQPADDPVNVVPPMGSASSATLAHSRCYGASRLTVTRASAASAALPLSALRAGGPRPVVSIAGDSITDDRQWLSLWLPTPEDETGESPGVTR